MEPTGIGGQSGSGLQGVGEREIGVRRNVPDRDRLWCGTLVVHMYSLSEHCALRGSGVRVRVSPSGNFRFHLGLGNLGSAP